MTRGFGEDDGGLYARTVPEELSFANVIPSGMGRLFGSLCNLGLTLLNPISRESFGLIGILLSSVSCWTEELHKIR